MKLRDVTYQYDGTIHKRYHVAKHPDVWRIIDLKPDDRIHMMFTRGWVESGLEIDQEFQSKQDAQDYLDTTENLI